MKTNENGNQEGRNAKPESKNQELGSRGQSEEQWWAGLKPGERVLARQIAVMMGEVTENKRIEIRKESGAIRARYVHILKQPEKGCLSAIVLPERASGGWN